MQLMQGDCLELMKEIPDGSVDMVLCDPPYGVSYKTGWRKDKSHPFCSPILGDSDLSALRKALPEMVRVLKDNSACYIFTSAAKQGEVTDICCGGLRVVNHIIWDKMNHTAGDLTGAFGRRYEVIVYAAKGRPRIRGKRYADIWQCPRVPASREVHQNQKPVELLERAICSMTDEGAVVLDPFMGSGSTGVACVNTGRDFIGIELDAHYFEIAKKRIEDAQAQVKMAI